MHSIGDYSLKKTIALGILIVLFFSSIISTIDSNTLPTKSTTPLSPKRASLAYVQIPSVTKKFIVPDDPNGINNFTIYSFSANYEVNYTLDIYAYYEPITHEGIFNPCSAYLLPNGTWIVAALVASPVPFAPATVLVGIGNNASSLIWHTLGQFNITSGVKEIAVAGNGTAIRVACLERMEYPGSAPIRCVNYFASDDYGETWTNGTIWDCSSSEKNWCPGITLAAYGNTFECIWAFANCSSEYSERYNYPTIWESRDQGTGWTQAKNLTALEGKLAFWPQAFFNQSNGCLYVAVNNHTVDVGSEAVIFEFGDGPTNPVTGNWSLTPGGSFSYDPLVYCALDYENQHFYFVNASVGIEEGIRNASAWQDLVGDLEPFPMDEDQVYFQIFAKGGPKLFAGSVTNVYGLERGGILDCESPYFLYRENGTLAPTEVLMHIFNGKDPNGNTHNASTYLLSLLVERDGEMLPETDLAVSVDWHPPQMNVSSDNVIISPLSSPGYFDVFTTEVNASEHGTAVLTIDALEQQLNGSTDVTDGLYTYSMPSLCGDGRVNFLFYLQEEGTTRNLMVSRTDTAGISWSTPQVVKTFEEKVDRIVSLKQGAILYVWVTTYGVNPNLILISSDEGSTFIPVYLPFAVVDVTSDLKCWNYTRSDTTFDIFCSTNLGRTWNLFLSIPQNGQGYDDLNGVAYDPTSGNYSFLLSNNSKWGLKLVIATFNGGSFTEWESLSEGAQGPYYFMGRSCDVNVRKLDSGTSEWIITSNNYGYYGIENFSTHLACRTTRGDGFFSSWDNFTGISGEIIPIIFMPGGTTILFPENATPCVATCIPDPTLVQELKQVRVFYGTPFVFSKSIPIPKGTTAELEFFGASNAGQQLPEGRYQWVVTFSDLAGQVTKKNGTLEIDNTAPSLGGYANLTTPNLPDPRYPLTVTVPARDLHLLMGTLRYRTSPTGAWSQVTMDQLVTGPTAVNFTGSILALGDVMVFWEVVINDSAGNSLVVNNAGQSFTYARANLRLEEEMEPPTTLDLSGGATLEVRFVVPEDAEYMDYVFIQYQFDDGAGMHIAIMSASGGSLYNFTIAEFPENASFIQYTVIGVDINGNQVLGRTRTISLIPALPVWEMSSFEQAAFLLISLVVGVVCGVVYSSMIRQRTGGRILTKDLVARVVQESRAQPGVELQENEAKKTGIKAERTSLIAITLALTGALAGIGGAVVYIFIYEWPEVAMLCLTGTMLAAVFLWILATDSAVRRTLRANKEKIPAGKIFGIFLVGLTIFVALLAILFIGDLVAWWRVRVNEQAYHIFGLTIPRMITNLAGTFFSSIILLTWSVGKDVTKTYQELHDAEINNENPGRIIALREVRMASILGAIGWKGVLFIAIIGSTLIFASDLSVYAPQGLLIIIPFVVGTVVTLAVRSFRQIKQGNHAGIAPMFFDRVGKCSACGTDTPVGGTYCENCGAKIITGERVKEGEYCPTCHQPTVAGVKHCRYCGNALKSAP